MLEQYVFPQIPEIKKNILVAYQTTRFFMRVSTDIMTITPEMAAKHMKLSLRPIQGMRTLCLFYLL